MQPRATWRTTGRRLCLGAAMLPIALPVALSAQNQPPPQSRLPVGFPGGARAWGNRPTAATPAPAAPAAPAPAPAAAAAPVASQLPPTPVTQTPAPPPSLPNTPGQRPAHRATVAYEQGKLTVKAHNSSLNQILRAIMRETGLQITGGVVEERVYGVYGPESTPGLLTTLLTGTGSDIFYIPAAAGQPAQLTLTSRDGSHPPPPSASASDDLLPDGPEDDPPPPAAQVATQLYQDPHQSFTPVADLPPGVYPVQYEPPRKKLTTLPPPTVDQVYQQILQLHAAEQKLGEQQRAAAAAAKKAASAPAAPAATPAPQRALE